MMRWRPPGIRIRMVSPGRTARCGLPRSPLTSTRPRWHAVCACERVLKIHATSSQISSLTESSFIIGLSVPFAGCTVNSPRPGPTATGNLFFEATKSRQRAFLRSRSPRLPPLTMFGPRCGAEFSDTQPKIIKDGTPGGRGLLPSLSLRGCQAPPFHALVSHPGCGEPDQRQNGRVTKRAVSDDFGAEHSSVDEGIGAKDRQRGHSSEARREKRALNPEVPTVLAGGITEIRNSEFLIPNSEFNREGPRPHGRRWNTGNPGLSSVSGRRGCEGR